MRRVLAVLFATGLALLALDGMAQAKPGEFGEEEPTASAAISGPGLAGPIGLDQAVTQSYEDLSNIFNPTSRMHVRPGAVDLGPRFELLFTLGCAGPSGTVSIRQDLYPYASYRGQPQVWTNTPAGQRACGAFGQVASGWNAARRGLFDALVSAGLPSTAPVAVPAPHQVQLPVPDPDRFWPVLWAVGALLTLVAVAVIAGRPRRRAGVLR